MVTNSKKKLLEKGCDWILANNISDNSGFSSDMNKVYFMTKEKTIQWKMMNKKNVSKKLVKKIVSFLKKDKLMSYE